MRLGQIWDYVMRRKPLFLTVLVVLGMSIIGLSQLWSRDTVSSRETTSIPTQETTYDNSLILRILSDDGQPAYELSFAENFSKAKITLSELPLSGEAYVRILDKNGALISGEYTEMRDVSLPAEPETEAGDTVAAADSTTSEDDAVSDDSDNLPEETGTDSEFSDKTDDQETDDSAETDETGETGETAEPVVPEPPIIQAVQYVFKQAPTTYMMDLEPGYIIEVRSDAAHFYSTLDEHEALNFAPTAMTERYIVTEAGLKRADWADEDVEEQMYQVLKTYLVGQIAQYQAQTSDEVLDHKTADLVAKTRIVLAYLNLREEDQAPWTEFIEHIKRGGSPVITYLGQTTYDLGTELDLAKLVHVQDGEDGELENKNLIITTNLNSKQAGEYYITYTATDSDQNQTTLTVEVEIVDPNAEPPVIDPEPIEKLPDDGFIEELPKDPVDEPVAETPVEPAVTPSYSDSYAAQDPAYQIGGEEPDDVTASIGPIVDDLDAQDDGTVFKPVEEPTNHELQSANTQQNDNRGISLIALMWLGFGVIALIFLIRFVFDHYIR